MQRSHASGDLGTEVNLAGRMRGRVEPQVDVRQEPRSTRSGSFSWQGGQRNASGLRERLADQHSGNDGAVRKVPAQEILIAADVPCCLHRPFAELANFSNKQKRLAVRQDVFG